MKYLMNTFLFAAFAANTALAQTGMNDTVRINYEDKVYLAIVTGDDRKLKDDPELKHIFTAFQQDLSKIQHDAPEYAHYRMVYQPDKLIEFEKLDENRSFAVQATNVQLLPTQQEAILQEKDFQLLVTFTALSDLQDPNIQSAINAVIEKLPQGSRFTRYTTFRYADGALDEAAYREEINPASLDLIELQFGAGASLIKNRPLTDIGLEIGLQFNKKGVQQHLFYLSDNLYYLFGATSEDQFALNNFLNLGYRHRFEPDNQLGIEIGLPIYKEGDFFKDNLMRVGFNWKAGKHITVAPQLYINKRFQSAYPGIRIGFGL